MKPKHLILPIIAMVVLLSFLTLASPSIDLIELLLPTNLSFDNNGVVFFTYNVSGNESWGYSCSLWTNQTGTWAARTTVSNVSNETIVNGPNISSNVTISGIPEGRIHWNVQCTAPSNSTVVTSGGNNSLTVDTTAPNVVAIFPLDNSWQRNGSFPFLVNVTDLNADQCIFKSNINRSTNATGTYNVTERNTSYTSGSAQLYNFSISPRVNLVDNNTGYIWDLQCNDSANNIAGLGSNYTVWVDSLLPTRPNVATPANATKSTSLTPVLRWLVSTELNFSRYLVQLDNDSGFGSPEFEVNISTKSQNFTTVTSGLSYDIKYFLNVTTFDLAGNSNSSLIINQYTTDKTCGVMVADSWNICAIVRSTTVNASTLCEETSCAYIAMYNSSNNFVTHTAGSSTNDEMTFIGLTKPNVSSVVFIYVENTNKTWANRTWSVDAPHVWFNMSNASTGWNIVPILNQTGTYTLAKLDASINGNGSLGSSDRFLQANNLDYMSAYNPYNASGSRYCGYAANRSTCAGAAIDYGSAVWIHINTSKLRFAINTSGEI